MLTEPVPGASGPRDVQKDALRSEVPFALSLQQIAGEVFISIGDSESDKARKQSGGFSVVEDSSYPIEKRAVHLRGGFAREGVPLWIRKPMNFRDLIGLVATNNSILVEEANATERELRHILYKGAENELSGSKLYIAERQILGDEADRSISSRSVNSVQEAQERIAGIEEFQRKLLERAQGT